MKKRNFIYVIILIFLLTGCSTLKSRSNTINIEFINTTPARIILDDPTKTKFTYILSDKEISKNQLEFDLGEARYINLETHLIEPYKNLGSAYKIKDYKIADVIAIEVNSKVLKAFKEKYKP